MRKLITVIVIVSAMVFGGIGYAAASITRVRTVDIPTRPCKSDSRLLHLQFHQCFYDAGVFGDGNGRSYWVVRDRPGFFCIQYLSAVVNSRNSFCYPASWRTDPPPIR